tara:strand:- start:85 stop:225 length:141 start_codon:yes stop_codon:yes gene_type:complete
MKPDTIELLNKNLTCEHLIDLLDFLANKEMVRELNLRRNKISNKGA